jgi:hypothetical protein
MEERVQPLQLQWNLVWLQLELLCVSSSCIAGTWLELTDTGTMLQTGVMVLYPSAASNVMWTKC